jgi:hypothetical protein
LAIKEMTLRAISLGARASGLASIQEGKPALLEHFRRAQLSAHNGPLAPFTTNTTTRER